MMYLVHQWVNFKGSVETEMEVKDGKVDMQIRGIDYTLLRVVEQHPPCEPAVSQCIIA